MHIKYELPTVSFPYKISRRINLMSIPRKNFELTAEGMPAFTPTGVRKSALRGHASDRINDVAWPFTRKLFMAKRMYRNRFSKDRLEKIDRMIEAANATMYSKLANCVIDLKKQETKQDTKKKRGWTESEWKKHMDYIGQIAGPKKVFEPPPVERGPHKPLAELAPKITELARVPEFKMYKRQSQEDWYRDPIKVSPNALKYEITARIREISKPKKIPE